MKHKKRFHDMYSTLQLSKILYKMQSVHTAPDPRPLLLPAYNGHYAIHPTTRVFMCARGDLMHDRRVEKKRRALFPVAKATFIY